MADKLKIIVCACCFQHQQALAAQQPVCTSPAKFRCAFLSGNYAERNLIIKVIIFPVLAIFSAIIFYYSLKVVAVVFLLKQVCNPTKKPVAQLFLFRNYFCLRHQSLLK